MICPFINRFISLLIDLFIDWLFYSSTYSLVYWLIVLFIDIFIGLLIDLLIDWLFYSSIYSLVYWLIDFFHWLIDWLYSDEVTEYGWDAQKVSNMLHILQLIRWDQGHYIHSGTSRNLFSGEILSLDFIIKQNRYLFWPCYHSTYYILYSLKGPTKKIFTLPCEPCSSLDKQLEGNGHCDLGKTKMLLISFLVCVA